MTHYGHDHKHKIDLDKLETALTEKGWKLEKYGAWVRPMGLTQSQAEHNWIDSILEAIVCPFTSKPE